MPQKIFCKSQRVKSLMLLRAYKPPPFFRLLNFILLLLARYLKVSLLKNCLNVPKIRIFRNMVYTSHDCLSQKVFTAVLFHINCLENKNE